MSETHVTNGSGPGEPKKKPRKWSAAMLRKARATRARNRAERLKAARSAAKGGKAPSGRAEAVSGRKGDSLGEQRLDAIVYLQAAVGHYEIPDEALLALLALRRLQGRIK